MGLVLISTELWDVAITSAFSYVRMSVDGDFRVLGPWQFSKYDDVIPPRQGVSVR